MSRTRILATYGPACQSKEVILEMLESGLSVFRLNVSHLDPSELVKTTRRLRSIAKKAERPLAILADMPGPKIRCTTCEPAEFNLVKGQEVEVAGGSGVSTPERILIPYHHLLEDVRIGHEIALNDGMVHLRVDYIDHNVEALCCTVLRGGRVSSRKGVSFLNSTLRVPFLTARDKQGLREASRAKVDFIALSFVREAKDLVGVRRILKRHGGGEIPLVSKIEQHEAVDNIQEIIDISDGVMVARGDLGIERPLEQVPLLQKEIIKRSNQSGKFVITATEMLESMIVQSRPTRAEVSDVANAILDGTDAVMLSAETAVGHNPALVVQTIRGIAETAEQSTDNRYRLRRIETVRERTRESDAAHLDDAVARAAAQLAGDANLEALVCLSYFGNTARRIARYRPQCRILVLSPYDEQCRRLALTWGLEVFDFPLGKPKRGRAPRASQLIDSVRQILRENADLHKGDRVAILAGTPLDAPSGTNFLRVIEV